MSERKGDTNANGQESLEGEFQSWYRGWSLALVKLATDLKPVYSEGLDLVTQLMRRLVREEVTLAFGGHFSSGKSTLINGLLGRPLLPMRDMPDTGSLCVLRAGKVDQAVVVHNDGSREPIPCTPESIRARIALRTTDGRSNGRVRQVDRLQLSLTDFPFPGSCWIDSPGINDSTEMDGRAAAAGLEADILVWVLNSAQLLSLREQDILADYLSERGPESLVFVVNAYLSQDTEAAWRDFQERAMPAHRNKLVDRAAELGFTGGARPTVVVTSARALCEGRLAGFGRQELEGLLGCLRSPGHPRVRRARLQGAVASLGRLVAKIEDMLTDEYSRLAKEGWRVKEQRQDLRDRQRKFADKIGDPFDALARSWKSQSRTCGETVASGILAGTLKYDNTYGVRLQAELRAKLRSKVERWLFAVEDAAREFGLSAVSEACKDEVHRLLEPWVVDMTVKQHEPANKGANVLSAVDPLGFFAGPLGIASDAAGRAAGKLWATMGAAEKDADAARQYVGDVAERAGAALASQSNAALNLVLQLGNASVAAGRAAGKLWATKGAAEKDADAARQYLCDVAERAGAALAGQRQSALNLVLQHCQVPDPGDPDDSTARLWAALRDRVKSLADDAATVAGGGPGR